MLKSQCSTVYLVGAELARGSQSSISAITLTLPGDAHSYSFSFHPLPISRSPHKSFTLSSIVAMAAQLPVLAHSDIDHVAAVS